MPVAVNPINAFPVAFVSDALPGYGVVVLVLSKTIESPSSGAAPVLQLVAVPNAKQRNDHRQILGKRRGLKVLVHFVRSA